VFQASMAHVTPDQATDSQPPVEAHALPKQKTEAELEQLYAGTDCKLGDVEKMMLKYDQDRDGQFSISEVKSIIRDLEEQTRTSRNLGRALIGTVCGGLLVFGAMFALMILSIEATKENHTRGNEMVTNSGESVRVASVESFSSVFDLPKLPVEKLQYLNFVAFVIAPNNSTAASSASFKVGGFVKAAAQEDDAQELHLFTTTGAEITIGPGRTGRLVTASGKVMPILDNSEGRRLRRGGGPGVPRGGASFSRK